MNPNKALSELNDILQTLQEKESLCDRRLLQKNELNDLYASLPGDIKSCVIPLDEISQRIFTKYIQHHNANTKWEHQDLTNIARKKDYESYIKPWMSCIQEILNEYSQRSEFQQILDDGSFSWLDSYPQIKTNIKKIQERINDGTVDRSLMDDLRLLIENFLQEYLGNKKSLENQFDTKNDSPLKKDLKARGIESEKITWLEQVLSCFSNYQNTYVKHKKKYEVYSYPDFEFNYLQIGAVIKYLSQL